MFTNTINLNQLPIFAAVYRSKSMTLAAQDLHMTQSGVSQHMKSLEDYLGVPLFDRVGQRLVPTETAHQLYENVARGMNLIEDGLTRIKRKDAELSGTVKVGMPIEFGNNVVLPLIGAFVRKNPKVHFKFTYDYASALSPLLLSGDLDFAFVDEFRMDKAIETSPVYDETLILCAAKAYLAETKAAPENSKKYYEQLRYVEYQKGEPLLRMWFEHHIKTRNLELNITAQLMDVRGVGRLINEGLGAGVLPSHVVERIDKDRSLLFTFGGCGKPLKNTISIAYLTEKTFSNAALAILTHLKKSLKKSA